MVATIRPDAIALSVCADDVKGDQAIDTVSRSTFTVPMPAPEDGCTFAWELQGVQGEHLNLPATTDLGDKFTIAVWCKFAPFPERDPGAVILADDCPLLCVGEDKASIGFNASGRCTPFQKDENSLQQWQMYAIVGNTTDQADTSAQTCILGAYTGDREPKLLHSENVSLKHRKLLHVGSPSLGGSLGCVSSVQMWTRALTRRELRQVWQNGCAVHGISVAAELSSPVPPSADVLRLTGHVLDAATGDPLAGVTVASVSSDLRAESDQAGGFSFDIPLSSSTKTSLRLSRPGFAPYFSPAVAAQPNTNHVELPSISLVPCGATLIVSASEPSTLTDDKTGTTFHVPGNVFARKDGSPFTGQVALAACVIDPSDETSLAAMPGDFSAVDASGQEVQLRSFGAMFVSATDAESGEELDLLAESDGIDVEWEARVNTDVCAKGGAFPSMWAFDSASGKWTQDEETRPLEVEGQLLPRVGLSVSDALKEEEAAKGAAEEPRRPFGKKKGGMGPGRFASNEAKSKAAEEGTGLVARFLAFFASGQGRRLRAKLQRPNVWVNCDAPYLQSLLRGTLGEVARWDVVASGEKALRVVAVGVDYASRSYATLGADGAFAIVVQTNSSVVLEVEVPHDDLPASADLAERGRERRDRLQWRVGPLSTAQSVGGIEDVGTIAGLAAF